MSAAAADLLRMKMEELIRPCGPKAKALLERKGIVAKDNKLISSAKTEAFKIEHSEETTPQIWIDGKRIGGFDALQAHFF